jgi:hypothetical protein
MTNLKLFLYRFYRLFLLLQQEHSPNFSHSLFVNIFGTRLTRLLYLLNLVQQLDRVCHFAFSPLIKKF